MKRFMRGLLAVILLSSLFILCILPMSAEDTGIITGDACGEGLTWQLDTATGELVISGEGSMTNYSIIQHAPWYEQRNLITSIRLEEGVTTVGSYAFLYCSRAVSVSLPQTLTAVNAFAFWQCTSLESVVLPEGVTTLGGGAFQNCSSLAAVTLPETLTRIETAAFSACNQLETVTLPHSLTTLGKSVFGGCPLSKVLYNGTAEEWAAISIDGNNAELTEALLFHPGHAYDQEVPDDMYLAASATCVDSPLYYKSCVCGEMGEETFSHGEPKGHTYADTVTPPTCTEGGFTTHVCADCENTYTDTPTEPTGHTPDEGPTCLEDQLCVDCGIKLSDRLGHNHVGEITQAPTCTEAGIRTYTCSRCPDTYDEAVDPTGHVPGDEATCTTHQLCSVCETILTEPLGHAYTALTVEPTCDKQGHTLHTCSRCSSSYLDSLTAAKGHTPGEAATCTEPQTCTVCNALLAEALGHEYTAQTVEPTCDQQGYTLHTCSRCPASYQDSPIPAKGHTPGEAATCTESQACTVCGALLAEALGHEYTEKTVESTCDKQGYTLHTCSRCPASYRDSLTAAKGHTPGEAATCTESQTCTVCGALLAEALGHEYTKKTVEPTCDEQGYVLHTCSRCPASYRDSLTAAKGHTPGAAATCTEPQTCTVCNALLADKLGHDYRATIVDATCGSQGYISHVCDRCSALYLDTFTPALGHTPGEEATCTTPQTCTVCRDVLTPAKGHTLEDTVIPPTCTDRGYTAHTCTDCSSAYADEFTEPTGHVPGEAPTCDAPQTCTVCQTVLAEKAEHQYEERTVEATCTADGQILRVCALCEDTYIQAVLPATGHTVGDWILDNHPDVGEPGRQHKECESCSVVLEAETFWVETEETDEPDETHPPRVTVSEDEKGEEESGCRLTAGNIFVIVIILAAAGLLWFVDLRRR